MEKIWLRHWPPGHPYCLEYPDRTLPRLLAERAAAGPDRPAIIFYGREITYGELDRLVDGLAAALAELGLQQGQRVSIFLDSTPNFIVAFMAVLRAGGIVVPSNPMLKELELEHVLNDSGAEIIIASDQLWPVVEAVRDRTPLKTVILTGIGEFLPAQPSLPVHPSLLVARQPQPGTLDLLELARQGRPQSFDEPDLNQLAIIQYTSGTTGMPKGAIISHANLLANVKGAQMWSSITPDDVHLSVLPFFHVTGMVSSMCTPLFTGGRMVLLTRFDLPAVVQAISDYRVTCWSSIATMNIALVNYPDLAGYRLESLQKVKSGGAPVPLEILNRFQALTGVNIMEGYGLSETIAQVTINPFHRPKLGTVGIPVYDVELKVLDLEDPTRELGIGQEGELAFKGPQVMQGYWRRPEATAEILQDGWLRTGDIGFVDEDGYVTIVGRAKELIKASGYSVFPAEVEALLYQHPAVREVAVIGVPDPYRGETIKAYVVLKPEFEGKLSEAEFLEWAQSNMASYKAPRLAEFRAELPHTGSGKLLKRVLAAEARAMVK